MPHVLGGQSTSFVPSIGTLRHSQCYPRPPSGRKKKKKKDKVSSKVRSLDPGRDNLRDSHEGRLGIRDPPGMRHGHGPGSCQAGWYASERPVRSQYWTSSDVKVNEMLTLRFRPRNTLSFNTRA